MKPKKNTEVELRIDRLVYGGKGIGQVDGFKIFVAGVAHSSYRHYFRRYADEEDLRNKDGSVQEVVIVDDETKKSRRGKK